MDKLIFFLSIFIFIFSILCSYFFNCLIIKIYNIKKIKIDNRKYLDHQKNKNNIPSLGGIGILISIILSFPFTLFINFDEITLISLISIILFGIIGLVDDLLKLKKKNSDGLNPSIRLFLEASFTILILSFLGFNFNIFKNLNINGIKIGLFSFPLLIFIFVGGCNASNIVDGLDGLNGGLSLIALIPNLFLAYKFKFYIYGLFIISIIGSLIGFLFLNSHPAKIFMGDNGSLSLGNSLIITSLVLNNIILIPILMFLFIIETLSIIIQVIYYKKTRKRIFLMAPLHHHFEKKNIDESKIVLTFYLIGIILSFIVILIGEFYGNINIR